MGLGHLGACCRWQAVGARTAAGSVCGVGELLVHEVLPVGRLQDLGVCCRVASIMRAHVVARPIGARARRAVAQCVAHGGWRWRGDVGHQACHIAAACAVPHTRGWRCA